eukprot:SAG31_NODE_1458_length_8257_cov_10.274209_5_plen_129_part_00
MNGSRCSESLILFAQVISTYQPVLPRYDPDGLQELFNEIDEDGSATLDRGEIANMCKTLGRELTARELEVAMQNMDADGKGCYFLFLCATVREIPGFNREKYSTNRESVTLQGTERWTSMSSRSGGLP